MQLQQPAPWRAVTLVGLVQGKAQQEVLQELTEAEQGARKGHVGMWRYGDPTEDDEDDRPARAWGRR